MRRGHIKHSTTTYASPMSFPVYSDIIALVYRRSKEYRSNGSPCILSTLYIMSQAMRGLIDIHRIVSMIF